MSPRSKTLNEQLREESRSKILHQALKLFSERGYDRTPMATLAKAADISPGLIYHYFSSKEELLRAIFETNMQDVQASFAEAEAADANARLERLIRASFDTVQRKLPFWRLSYGVRMQPSVLAALGHDVLRWAEVIKGTLERYLREAGAKEPELEAAILFALIDGVAQHYALDPARYPLEAVTERIVRVYKTRLEAPI